MALIGRSNVGKSSLLNALAGRHDLARTSRTPGRTRLLNLYRVNGGQLRLVDCPGYGYARAGRSERARWGALVEAYLGGRDTLRQVVLLVDARLEPQALDLDMTRWLRQRGHEPLLVATKWDRLSGNQRPRGRLRLEAAFAGAVVSVSAATGEGIEGLRRGLLAPARQGR